MGQQTYLFFFFESTNFILDKDLCKIHKTCGRQTKKRNTTITPIKWATKTNTKDYKETKAKTYSNHPKKKRSTKASSKMMLIYAKKSRPPLCA